jgi:hypothetical protein
MSSSSGNSSASGLKTSKVGCHLTPISYTFNCRLKTLFGPTDSWPALYSLATDPTENTYPDSSPAVAWHTYRHGGRRKHRFSQLLHCRFPVYWGDHEVATEPLPSNGRSLQRHSLATAISAGFTILVFNRHAKIFTTIMPITVAARSNTWTVFTRSKHWGRRFESNSRRGCLSAFILCLSCPV